MIVRRDEFSIGINQSKNNNSNIDNSINSCFQISHDSHCRPAELDVTLVAFRSSGTQKSCLRDG